MYKGYVLKNEFMEYFGKEYKEVLKEIFCYFGSVEDWSWEDFKSVSLAHSGRYFEYTTWYISYDGHHPYLSGWHEFDLERLNYFHVTPQEFVKNILGEKMNKQTYTAKPRFHKKRKPVPVRKKTDITVYYSTGEKYTIKNVKALCVKGDAICIAMTPEVKNGYFKGNSLGFTTGNVDSLLVKTPKGSYTLDSVGDNEFILTEEGSVITLTELNQTF